MKSTLKNLLTISLLASVISNCTSNKTADLLIPEDASMVVHINAPSLSSKLSWAEIKNSEWFRMFNKEKSKTDLEQKLLDDPSTSGVDMNSDMYFFMKPSGRHGYMAFQGKLKDVKAFEEMVKKLNEKDEIKRDGNISYIGNGLDFMTWTSDRFMMVGETKMNDGYGDEYKGAELTKDSVLNFAKATYNLKSNKSMGSNSKFSSLLNDKGDLHIWISNSLMMGGGNVSKQISFLKASSVFEGNSTGMTVNFDNGKITGTSKTYYNKQLKGLYEKYLSGNLDVDMLKKIPGENVAVVMAFKCKPEGIKEFLKLLGFDGLADGYLREAGVSLDDVIAANKGDLMLAVSDFSMKKDPEASSENSYSTSSMPGAKILFATSINNKGAFDKVIDAVKNTMNKEGGENAGPLGGIKYEIKDNWFIAGNSQENVTAYGSSATDHPFISKISGHPFGGYINIKKITSGMDIPAMVRMQGAPATDINALVNVWDDIVFYGGEMKDDAAVSHFEINLTDKNTNSLKQLNSFLGSVAKTYFRGFDGEVYRPAYPPIDTTSTVPPPVNPN